MLSGSIRDIGVLSVLDYRFIGWCREDNHDKIWGVLQLSERNSYSGKYLTFWGRRGKALRTKLVDDSWWKMDRLIESKERKGYQSITPEFLIETVYPEFNEDLEKLSVYALLLD